MLNTNNDKITPIKPFSIRPFTWFCMSIGAIPTAYSEALSYPQQILFLINFIKDTVIPAVNNNASALEELQNLMIELQEYVDNYFESTDFQKLIANKLDEMAENGKLAEIINQEIFGEINRKLNNVTSPRLTSELSFDNSLKVNDIVKTIGYYNKNDRGSSNILIKNNKDSEKDIPFENGLYGEIIENKINVKSHGVYGDGEHDDSTKIQELINNYPLDTLYFPKGEYIINKTLVIKQANKKSVNIVLDKNAIIKSTVFIDCFFEIGFDISDGYFNRYNGNPYLFIVGGQFDCYNVMYAIKINSRRKLVQIYDCVFTRIRNYGLFLYKETGSISGDVKCQRCYFQGVASNTDNVCTAILVEGNDNEFNNIRIDWCRHGIKCLSGGNYFFDIHATTIFDGTPSKNHFNQTIGISFEGANNFNSCVNCYWDTFATGIKCINRTTRNYNS